MTAPINKHTPGPWSVNSWHGGGISITIGATGTPLIATAHLRDVSVNQLKANALLISAAPELLAALQEIDNWLVCSAIATPEDMAQSFQHMQGVASAAIAKAKGGA